MAIIVSSYTPKEMAVLRRPAAQKTGPPHPPYTGTALPASISGRLRLCLNKFHVLRDKNGKVAGFGRQGFVVTPCGWGHYGPREEVQRQDHINYYA
jgi:hypothetical protein